MGSLERHESKTISFFKGLNSLREKGELLDITLIIQDVHFKAHKVVLSSYSDYFRAMFTHKMLESRQDEIILNGITAAGFSQVLEYFYTSKIILDLSNVQDVLEAAMYIQVPEIIQICLEYLLAQINIDSCSCIATLAEMYSLEELKMKVYKFMSEHLLEFSESEEFYRLTSQQVENLLSLDFCVDCSEDDVLRVILAWFFHVDHPKYEEDFKHIIHLIRFNQISPRKFENLLEECFQGTNPELEWYREMLLEGYFQKSNNTESRNSNLPRGMEMVIVEVGGCSAPEKITFCSPKEGIWRHLTTIPDSFYEVCCYGIISVINNELYVTGSEEKANFGVKFSPLSNEWKKTAPMKINDRHLHSLNAVGNKLYAICGGTMVQNVQVLTNTCERYDPERDEWNTIEPFPFATLSCAGASYESSQSDLKLFISGGLTIRDYEVEPVSSMYCYIVREDKWHRCAPMLKARFGHVMFSIGNHIYVCGGLMTNDYISPVDTIDVYDIENDCWKSITQVPTPRYDAGIICLERKIYFIGGLDVDGHRIATTESYDIDAGLWTPVNFKYPEPNKFFIKCASILISKWVDYPPLLL